jgi:hypothetical protein
MSPKSHVSTHRPALQSTGRAVYDKTNGDLIHLHQTLWLWASIVPRMGP